MRVTPILAGMAILFAAAPCVAGPSSKAEREATRLLNAEQAQKAEAANAPSRPKARDASANNPMNSPPAAAPTARIARAPIADAQPAPAAAPAP